MANSSKATYSSLGRWLSADPIGFQGGLNLYNYVGQNPTNAVDPSGLEPTCTVTIKAYSGWPGHVWLEARKDHGTRGFNAGLFPEGVVYEAYQRIGSHGQFTDRWGPRPNSHNADHTPEASATFKVSEADYDKLRDWVLSDKQPSWELSHNCAHFGNEAMAKIGKRLPRGFYETGVGPLLPSTMVDRIKLVDRPPVTPVPGMWYYSPYSEPGGFSHPVPGM